MKYQVQEFSAGKWWPLRSFSTEHEANEYRNKFGTYKTRVKQIKG